VEELVAAGARRASSPAQVAQECDVVLACLPDVPTSDRIFLGQDGLLAAARPGQVFVDHSTVTLALSRRCAQAARARKAYFLDAPISGGPERAADGTLTIMVGGDRQAFDRVEPVFKAMGKNVRYVGSSGAGTVFKLVNQLLVSINICGVAEAMVMAERAGADRQALLEVLNTSWGGSAVLARTGPIILAREFNRGAPIKHLAKDIGIIQELARDLGMPLQVGDSAARLLREAVDQGLGENDIAALVVPLEKRTGTRE